MQGSPGPVFLDAVHGLALVDFDVFFANARRATVVDSCEFCSALRAAPDEFDCHVVMHRTAGAGRRLESAAATAL